jgi:hypothetical protein
MPDWLISILIQYPIVVVVGFVAWYSYREIKEEFSNRLRREEATHLASVAEQKEFQRQLVEAKNAEIARLKDEFRKEIDKLVKRLDELNRRLGS